MGMQLNRHYGMDWLRISAFAILILYHIGMYFVPWSYHVKIAQPLDWVTIPMRFTNAWRLALLFLVSGYASAALLSKLVSPVVFIRSRTARLGVPLLFGMVVIIPVQPWIELVTKHGYVETLQHFWLHDYFRFEALNGIDLPTWQHLWFIVYLWAYTMLAAMLLLLVPTGLRARVSDQAARWLSNWRFLYLPMAAWLVLEIAFPDHNETHALFDDGPSHLHYLVSFGVGWLLRTRPTLFEAIAQCWKGAAMLALVAFLFVAWVEWRWSEDMPVPDSAAMLFDPVRLVQGWATIVALVGLADRFWNVDHRWRAMLAEAVFPFYIIHQTIIVVVGWCLLRAGIAALPSFLTLLSATVTGCWLFYAIGRNIGWLRPLIGLQRN